MQDMDFKQIQKRTGEIVDFDFSRIEAAITKAIKATPDYGISAPNFLPFILDIILGKIEEDFFSQNKIPNVENIQDIVEEELVKSGNFIVAKTYILYREEHKKQRIEQRLEALKKLDKNLIKVIKYNGDSELFSKEKLKKVWEYIAAGYEKECSFEDLFNVFKITLVDGIKTDQILINLRKAAIDLISVDNIFWQILAGRLYVLELYKKAIRNRKINLKDIYTPPAWQAHFQDYLSKNYYSKKFNENYTKEEIFEAGKWLNKNRDFEYGYSTMLAFSKRYLLNPNKIIHELPQEMYLAAALFLAIPEAKENRLKVAREIYEATSSQKLSLATPTLLNARTNFHQLSSCFKLNIEDDLRSIYHGIENMAQISKFGGGVGVYLGHIRSRGGSIRGVKNTSGGVVPWIRVINDTAMAVNQLGARAGAISVTLDIWHRDIGDFLNLQTETGDIRSKAFDIYPAVSVPDLFMERVAAGEDWTLFDPHEVFKITGKKLEDCFNEDFKNFYLACEDNENLKLKEKIKAKDLMKTVLKTAVETGMPYFFFRDTVNRANPNKHAGNIYSTQLCTEICQNTAPSKFKTESHEDGEVKIIYTPGDTVVCNLASINIAKVYEDAEIKKISRIAMRVLDNVITLNFYPIKESELTAKKYRSIGLGFMGLAEYLASQKLSYDSQEAQEHSDALFEKYAYYALEASNNLSAERGAYSLFKNSDWERGVLFGREQKWFSENSKTKLNWDNLINQIKKNGVRFAYHFAPAPNTSTAGVAGTTAGLLPIYKKFFVETNSLAPTVNVAPGLSKENFWYYKEYINLDMPDVIDMIAVIYKWIDQSISFEWMMNPAKTSPADLYNWYFKAWKSGIKTVYYLRSMSGEIADNCVSCSG